MVFDTIISQYDEHNEAILFLIDKFKPKKLVFIIDILNNNISEKSKNNYKKIFTNKEIIFEKNELGNRKSLENIITKYSNVLVNLSVGEKITSLLLLELALNFKIHSIYIDFINKKRYVFRDKCTIINNTLKDISLEDICALSGVEIVNESSALCEKEDIVEISKIILKNMFIWHSNKDTLYNTNIFKHNYKDITNIDIDTGKLDRNQQLLVDKSINYLKGINGIEYIKNRNIIAVKFKNSYLKSFLFKSGTWLEVITYFAVKNIKEIDEVRSGVVFSWGGNATEVKNELDVIAIKDSVLICISCKDSSKYDEDALNELSIYSQRLGGKDTVKILVASKKPDKITVMKRAEEMNIKLIIIEKDINIFQKSIEKVINGYIK